MPGRLGHVPALDGIRGIAIALVVGLHFFGIPPGGTIGVDLFFVLSGFLITTLLIEERAETGAVSFRAFYERRARRLFPALAVVLIVFLIFGGSPRVMALDGLYISNIVHALEPHRAASALGPLWSLSEEEQFYLVWPAALLFLLRRRRPIVVLGVLLGGLVVYRAGLIASGASWARVYSAPDTHSDGLIAGAMLALVRASRPSFTVPEWVGKSGGAIIVACMILLRPGPGWLAWGLPISELGCIMLVAAAAAPTELAQALSARWLVWLGKISYSLYIWHFLVIWLVIRVLGFGNPFVDLACSVLIAWLSFRFVERPFRRSHLKTHEPPRPAAAGRGVARTEGAGI